MRYFLPLLSFLIACGSNGIENLVTASFLDAGITVESRGEFCCRVGDTGEQTVGQIRLVGGQALRRMVLTARNATVSEEFPLVGQGETLIDVKVTGCPADAEVTVQLDGSELGLLNIDRGPTRTFKVTVKPALPPELDPQLPSLRIFGLQVLDPELIAFEINWLRLIAQGAADPLAFVAGSNGLAQYNVRTGEVVTQTGADGVEFTLFQQPAGYFGALLLHYENGADVQEGLFTFGPSEGILQPRNADGRWANFVNLAFRFGVLDASYLAGREGGHEILVSHGGLSSFHYDAAAGWTRTDLVFSVPGSAIAAVGRTLDGDRLIVTQDGRLYQHTGDTSNAPVEIANFGGSARRIRAAGRLAVISNFENDTLTLVRWETDGTVEVLETIAAGDGPVGIDVREVDAGIAIVSTGLNDDTYTITVVDPTTLAVVRSVTNPVPAGVTGPGHAAWASDTHIAITGSTSNNAAVFDVAADLAGP